MREPDFPAFCETLDAVCSLLSRGAYAPSSTNTALFFRALARHDIGTVIAGFDAHVRDPQRGRFVPVPADILAQIEGLAADDGRPGPEEAWAIAMGSRDEAATVVWTQEIAEAWRVATTVLDAGDEVGARMAFREAYSRLVEAARQVRKPAGWVASLGFDASRRDQALQAAGPAPSLLALTASAGTPPDVREQLLRLRDRLAARADEPGADAVERERTEALKAQTARRVANYTGGAA